MKCARELCMLTRTLILKMISSREAAHPQDLAFQAGEDLKLEVYPKLVPKEKKMIKVKPRLARLL